MNMIGQEIPLKLGQNKTSIVVSYDRFSDLAKRWAARKSGRNIALVSHEIIDRLHGQTLAKALESEGFKVYRLHVAPGESSKSLPVVSQLLDQILSLRLDRHDSIMALGGGVIGDLAGFVAAIYMRGIALVQVPTTLLAQVDAAIGGKTGVNHPLGKNLIGSFYQPHITWIDLKTLETLPEHELRCGLAEVVKYGVIGNPDLFGYLETHQETICRLNVTESPDIWRYLVEASAKDKADVVSKDEKEAGLRASLNFGHTVGHGLEASANYGLSHGEAVAMGMVAASHLAVSKSMWSNDSHQRLLTLLTGLGFSYDLSKFNARSVLEKMRSDKKNVQGKCRFVLPTEIGKVSLGIAVDDDAILSTLMGMGANA